MSSIYPIEVSIDSFQELVIKKSHKQLVILDISAQWCTPCRILEPILSSVAAEYNNDEFSLTKLEAEDENMKIAGQFSVRGFPQLLPLSEARKSCVFTLCKRMILYASLLIKIYRSLNENWYFAYQSWNTRCTNKGCFKTILKRISLR
ncbi:thioredoxin family protein [Bathymodiolus azoricus thioautotrophic gill symbiont]|jgi:putative thioredoxin|uniref:thioredoxin family protein n=1 Tax=Bathymodiolus azoricus thioautotrophic gill symbiont TaxID=235205 RepID=UPI001F4F0F87|nr:thioredoxin domain-containing protein [Bathymodiolus azoricus thioautotrophic gill symbiont]